MKNSFTINLDGAEKIVAAEVIDKKIWFKIDHQIYSYDIIDLAEGHFKKSKAAGKSSDKVSAPMPGKVTRIFISEKQAVNKGEALLVMEAMKMEYTLKSDIAATVEKIYFRVGDQVTLNSLMVQLKEIK